MTALNPHRLFFGRNRNSLSYALKAVLPCVLAAVCPAQELPSGLRERVDREAMAVIKATGAPSASIAIVRDGKIAYEQAYGDARIAGAAFVFGSMRASP